MQKLYYLFILSFVFYGCGNNDLSSAHVTSIPVVRNVNETIQPKQEKEHVEEPQIRSVYPAPGNNKMHVDAPQSHYYIIVASCTHGERAKAERMVNELKRSGYDAEIIDAKGRLRVSIQRLDSEQEAREQRDTYRLATDRPDIWLLKLP